MVIFKVLGVKKMLKHWLLLIIAFLIIGGCGVNNRGYVLKNPILDSLESVAVLPFENFSNDPVAGEKIRRMIMQELVKRGFFVIETGEVNRVLVEKEIVNLSLLGVKELREIGEKLGVKYLIKGGVFSYEIQRFADVTYPSVAIQITLIETSSGKIVRSTYRTEGGPNFRVLYLGMEAKTLNEVAKEVVRKALFDIF